VLDRILGRGPSYTVRLLPEERAFTGRRGDTVYNHGHVPVSLTGRELPESSHETSDKHVHHCQVAGTHHMPRALAESRFDLGSRIQLRLQPQPPDDAQSVGVWDATGAVQVGFVPATLSRQLAPALKRGRPLGGEVIRELRLGSPTGERVALYILIAPPGRLELVYGDGEDAGAPGAGPAQ
jgi:hypothetical protein